MVCWFPFLLGFFFLVLGQDVVCWCQASVGSYSAWHPGWPQLLSRQLLFSRCLELFFSKCRILHFLLKLLKLLRVHTLFFFPFLAFPSFVTWRWSTDFVMLVITVDILDCLRCLAVHSPHWTYPKLGCH